MSKQSNKKSWVVEMICKVRKEVILNDCTQDEARLNPWDFAEDEVELEQIDWEVVKVRSNE